MRVFLLLAAILLGGCGPSRNPAREAIDRATEATPVEAGWTCPMHPEVHSDEPGSCPKCGMALEKVGA
jgi:hypothetical protein